MNLLDLLNKNKSITKIMDNLKKDRFSTYISGTSLNLNCSIAYDAFTLGNTILYIAPNTYKATHAYECFCRLAGEDCVSFYCVDELSITELVAISSDFRFERIKTLQKIKENKPQIIVTHVQAILKPVIDFEVFKNHIIDIKVGDDINTSEIINTLIESGYKKTSTCENVGEFSVRGEIIDIYPIFYTNPIRLDLFDTEIEMIKQFDPVTQKSIDKLEDVQIYPVSDFIYTTSDIERLENSITIHDDKVNEEIQELYGYDNPDKLSKYISLIDNKEHIFMDYLNNYIVFFENFNESKEKYSSLNIEIENFSNPLKIKYLYDPSYIVNNCKQVFLDEFRSSLNDVKLTNIFNLNSSRTFDYHSSIKTLIEDLKYTSNRYYILLQDNKKKELIKSILSENQIAYSTDRSVVREVNVWVCENAVSFKLDEEVFLTEKEIFQTIKRKTKFESSKYNTVTINTKDDIKSGDYVVHYDHGIGIYKGLETVELGDIKNDYLVIQYANMDLYMPVEKITLLEKYLGTEGSVPKLNKIGTNEWKNKKEKIREKIEDIARELIQTQAERMSRKGVAYHTDPELMHDFEEGFEYEETKDQLQAIKEISKDMEQGLIIDRLVCGDVGYGKTEIAARAAFKTVEGGKQVAYLAPTTILSRQHYATFCDRFEKYGIKVRVLNRLVPIKEQTEIIKGLKDKTIDIVIGTHRLLSDDVRFKDLGLLIIDEEQRFGVAHKEKIKRLKTDVNVLTLTATPIPRTLQMSMMGVRQFSLINTPPKDRYPIQTYVLEYNDGVVKEAIYKELSREGQVFYLHNNISTLPNVMKKIKRLVPEARVCMAHGRMEKEQLEDVIQDYIDKKYDVLVCTTIIETGIDIPNSNTLIIDESDRLGLSQLYQIRGRIGRSDKIAYAYLMYKKDKVLTQTSVKRLNAIKEFTKLGSGYKIALRDLAIRGAGDILGKEQSGFIDMVGMDLYMKMLDESIKKLTGEKLPKQPNSYNIDVSKHVSDSYVSDEEIKILIHEKINNVYNKNEKKELIEELTDRFGKLKPDILLYIEERYLEKLLNKFDIEKVYEEDNYVMIVFPPHISSTLDGNKVLIKANQITRNFYFEYKNKMLSVKLKGISNDKKWIFTLCRLLENI